MASGDTRGMLEALAAMLKDTETRTRMVQKVGCCLRLLVGDDNGLFLDLRGGRNRGRRCCSRGRNELSGR
ncbi:expressed unknown protein [Ectocarpus siliculosus]|uniref:Uncharacterized protein n=1 Tax=Ectocarpus siliculosus TaxID=2880 RepID=D7FR10_ECTSI|nr:expressed unknown protein [Ectocarpus siliculosus]|eukprot:CBJ26164.1 expressed unknown protein [Ectocarpus siliculosus]